jgi:hypothetical protein
LRSACFSRSQKKVQPRLSQHGQSPDTTSMNERPVPVSRSLLTNDRKWVLATSGEGLRFAQKPTLRSFLVAPKLARSSLRVHPLRIVRLEITMLLRLFSSGLASVVAVLITANSAEARRPVSRLTPDEQRRVVCVPDRAHDPSATPAKVCMTGRDWEIALGKHRAQQALQNREWLNNVRRSEYLASRMSR